MWVNSEGIIKVAVLWAQLKELWQEEYEVELEIESMRKKNGLSGAEMKKAEKLAWEINKGGGNALETQHHCNR